MNSRNIAAIFLSCLSVTIVIIISICFLLVPGCKSPDEKKTPVPEPDKEELIRNQQFIVKDESADIDAYAARRNLVLTTTQTGLRYKVYHEGPGNHKAVRNDHVRMNYTVSLLDGSAIYSSDSSGALEFQVGKSEIAGGLQEGVTFMKEGDKAIFIVPSHLAYGLTGDGDRIKQYETLVIDAELLKILPGTE
jgi:FKBP-type peptidyl-prolyl cis-trans isomerase